MIQQSNNALFYAAIVSLGGFLFGFDATVISGVVGFVTTEFALNDYQIGWVVGIPTFTGILAAVSVGPLADKFGRKIILQLLALLYAVSAVLSALAPDYLTLVIARGIGGLAFGSLGLAPIYIAETSPARLRGRMVSVNQLNIVVGFSAAYFANYYILEASQSGAGWIQAIGLDVHTWRWMLGLEALPAVLYFCLLFLAPESPRWLYLQGRTKEARATLAKIIAPEKLEWAFANIGESASHASSGFVAHLKELLHPKLRLVLFLGVILGIVQQASGINAVYFYAPTIFEQAGVGTNAAFAQAVWIGIINIIFTLISMALIDKMGRKPLMVIGLAGVIISMGLISFSFKEARYTLPLDAATEIAAQANTPALTQIANTTFENDVSFKDAARAILGDQSFRVHEAALLQSAMKVNATAILVGILGFVASFAFSLGPVMWVLLSEIFPNHMRAVSMAFVGFFNSLVSFAVQFLFPVGLSTLGAASMFAIYAALSVIGLALVAWLLPETKGRTLEQLEKELAGDPDLDIAPAPGE